MDVGIGTSTLRSLGRRAPLPVVGELLEAGLDAGVLLVDTSNAYGSGSAERALALAVRRSSRLTANRARLRIVTKGGYAVPDLPPPLHLLNQPLKRVTQLRGSRQRFDEAALRRSWAGSRRRLGELPVHAYCLHNPPRSVLERGLAVQTLRRLQDRGAFALVGVSIDDPRDTDLLPELEAVGLVELPAEAWTAMPAEGRRRLRERGLEVVVNRVTALDVDPVSALRRLAAADVPPDVAVVGTRNAAHLRADAAAVRA